MSPLDGANGIRALHELKHRYVRLVDAKDWSGLAACLAGDFEFEGQFAMRGATGFVERVKADLGEAVTVHELQTPQIEMESAESAHGTWPFTDFIDERHDGTGLHRRGIGHYHERYEMQSGRWLIAAMRITRVRVECARYDRGRLVSNRTCNTQEELVEWLRRERAT